MNVEAVTNSTCLIVLDRIDRLDLLQGAFDRIWAPPQVAAEVRTVPSWVALREVRNPTVAAALELQIAAGEAATIALAVEIPGTKVVLDDKKARRIAGQLGLRIVGTLGIVLRAKASGRIAEVLPVLQAIQGAGFYMTPALLQQTLRLAGELT